MPRGRFLSLVVVASGALGACSPAFSLLGAGLTPLPGASPGGSAGLIADGSAGLAGLAGRLTMPDTGLVGNNSAQVAVAGGGAYLRLGAPGRESRYGIQAVSERPVGGATIELLGPNGEPLTARTVRTDEQGRYAFPDPGIASESVIVRATFDADGKAYAFETFATVRAGEAASADIDAASTLVSAKLRSLIGRDGLDLRGLPLARILAVARAVRRALLPGLLPYMASGSADILPAFDQLALDDADVRTEAAAVGARLEVPGATRIRIRTIFDSDSLIGLGIYRPGEREFTRAGTFEVDGEGNLYFPTFAAAGAPISVVRVTPAGATASYATLPPEVANPVWLAFAPSGTLFAMAPEPGAKAVRLFHGAGAMQRRPGAAVMLGDIPPEKLEATTRVAVDRDETAYFAVGNAHVLGAWSRGTLLGRVLAGQFGQPGFKDGVGTAAQFNRPFAVTLGQDGNLYVGDVGNLAIRRVTPEGDVSVYAGGPGSAAYRSGRGSYARFGLPGSLLAGPRDDIFVSDSESKRIRRISGAGSVFLVAGSGQAGVADGPAHEATFNRPRHLASDGVSSLYLTDLKPAAAGQEVTELIRAIARER